HEEERVAQRRRVVEHERALAEIIQHQRGQDKKYPSGLHRLPAEMSEIVVKRLGADHDEEDGTQRHEADDMVVDQERESVIGTERDEDAGIGEDLRNADGRKNDEPDRGDGSEEY